MADYSARVTFAHDPKTVQTVNGRGERDVRRKIASMGVPHVIGWLIDGEPDRNWRALGTNWRGEGLNHTACCLAS